MGLYIQPTRPSVATWRSGSIVGPAPSLGNGTRTPALGQVWYIPVLVPHTVNVNKIGTEVTAVGVAATLRYGIYTDKNGFPDQLVAGSDAGSLAVSGTGVLESTVNVNLGPGLYWIAVNSPVATSTPTVRSTSGAINTEFAQFFGAASGVSFTQGNAVALTAAPGAVVGAFPSTAQVPTSTAGSAPLPYFSIT